MGPRDGGVVDAQDSRAASQRFHHGRKDGRGFRRTRCARVVTEAPREAQAKPARSPASPIRAALWLAVVLIGAKAALLGAPQSARWILNLAAVSFQDVIFALGIGVTAELAVRAAARRAWLARTIGRVF